MLFYKGGNTLESQVEQNKNVCKLDIYLMMKYHKFNDIIFNDDVLEAFPLLSEKNTCMATTNTDIQHCL